MLELPILKILMFHFIKMQWSAVAKKKRRWHRIGAEAKLAIINNSIVIFRSRRFGNCLSRRDKLGSSYYQNTKNKKIKKIY